MTDDALQFFTIERVQQTAGDSDGVRFAFDPPGALIVSEQTGVATFIVEEIDLGTEFRFTCTGTNAGGTGPPSNSQSVIPVAAPLP